MRQSQVIKDLEEALKREIAKITTFYSATKSDKVLETTFDTFTGEQKVKRLKLNFYNEKSGANAVEYPRCDLAVDGIDEDRESGRSISLWEYYQGAIRDIIEPNQNRPKVYEQALSGRDGTVNTDGTFSIPLAKLQKVDSSYLLKIVSGNNKATYKIKDIDLTNQKIELQDELVTNIQELSFNENTRKLYLLNPEDIFIVRPGDKFIDASATEFIIQSIDTKKREFYLGGQGMPDLSIGSKIVREGNVLRNVDSSTVCYIFMDPAKPLYGKQFSSINLTDEYLTYLSPTPFNYYFTIEIKNKERNPHIEMAERMTETLVNRPRRAIYVLLRGEESAESRLVCGTSDGVTIKVENAKDFSVNDSVYITNSYSISENNQIIDIDYTNNIVTLRNRLPNDFNNINEAKLVSNAELRLWQFFLNGEVTLAEDSSVNFYRQEYPIKIEGWKFEKSGDQIEKAIQGLYLQVETPNKVEEVITVGLKGED